MIFTTELCFQSINGTWEVKPVRHSHSSESDSPCTLLKCMVLREKESGWGQAEPGTVNIFEGQRIYSKRDPQCMSEWVVFKRPRSQLWDRESARGLRVTLPEASLQVLWTLLHRCESKAQKATCRLGTALLDTHSLPTVWSQLQTPQ